MSIQHKQFYVFGNFRLNVTDRVLLRGEMVVRLMPKAVETLLILIQYKGQVVGKEELLRVLWPDVIVEENNLSQHISALRKTLGEDDRGNGYIETIPKRVVV
jgi:DNA-binding winged helix-turn-helix (wHTH) protein